jgi:hypothetical protein
VKVGEYYKRKFGPESINERYIIIITEVGVTTLSYKYTENNFCGNCVRISDFLNFFTKLSDIERLLYI